jgi:crotonobetainyl-CoA:carnitine CoA-transferase CaiB-like acyl-CoA transferase
MGDKKALLLGDYRVLDLTDEKGYLCGKMLGDLGADVIKIEKPGGDPGRNIGPFYRDLPDLEKSLSWFAYNTNKRGITLNIESIDGQSIFRRLSKKADIIIESFPPGYLEGLGIGYLALSNINPRIIMTSITAFGQDGPYKDFRGPDIVVMAMGGAMYVLGDPDRPPVRISVDQAFYHAASDAAVGSVFALYHRIQSGEGQHIDVSAQESMMTPIMEIVPYWDIGQAIRRRSGSVSISLVREDIVSRHTWPCKDGFVMYEVLGGPAGAKYNRALVEWAHSEGMTDELLNNMDWECFDYAEATQDTFNHIIAFFGDFFAARTKEELFRGAMERRIILYPVADVKDIAGDEQLKARNFWQHVPHPELDATVTYPGAFAKSPGADLSIRRRPPLVGEHNEEIYKDVLGLSNAELLLLKQNGII